MQVLVLCGSGLAPVAASPVMAGDSAGQWAGLVSLRILDVVVKSKR